MVCCMQKKCIRSIYRLPPKSKLPSDSYLHFGYLSIFEVSMTSLHFSIMSMLNPAAEANNN